MVRLASTLLVTISLSLALARAFESHTEIPLGLPVDLAATLDAERPRAELGARLFKSAILSADHSIACVNCHDPGRGFAKNEAFSKGVFGHETTRNVPTILNRALGAKQMWDGKAASLEEQVLMPIAHPDEMGLPLESAIARLDADADWRAAFESIYGSRPDKESLANALAAFIRSQLVGNSPIDAFRAGRFSSLDDAARQGLWLFESRGGCWQCHSGPNFSDEDFHATGIGARDGKAEDGRFAITGDPADRGRFKTPTLRALRHTAPYMHDGSLATLTDVVEFYSRGGSPIENLDPRLKELDLSEVDKANLVAFLEALSDVAPKNP